MKQLFLFAKAALFMFVIQGACFAGPSQDWALKDLGGKTLKLADFRGKWVLVNFWATWCPPCLAEIPDLVKLTRDRPDNDVIVIGIALGYHNSKDVIDFVQKQAIPYPVVLGNEDIAGEFGGLVGLPTSLLFAPSGKFMGSHDGPLNSEDFKHAFQAGSMDGVFSIH
jgi:thiol-disulfide isomerase/thioredoxin